MYGCEFQGFGVKTLGVITNLSIDNFRSLRGVNIDLDGINFIVGPNASGKSNFVAALDFLSHAANENLQYAVAEQGGFYNMSHRRTRRGRSGIQFKVESRTHLDENTTFEFRLAFELCARGEDIRADFYVASEQLLISICPKGHEKTQFNIFRDNPEGEEKNTRYSHGSSGPELTDNIVSKAVVNQYKMLSNVVPSILQSLVQADPQGLLISGFMSTFGLLDMVSNELKGCRIFQLNPRVARQPSAPSVHGDMGRRGENLASALDRMRLEDPDGFSKLACWIKDVAPTLTSVITDYTDTRQLGLYFLEEGSPTRWFAEDISDGTIMSLALFFVLLDNRNRTVVIEEPENTLHPWILKKFLERCREKAKERQLIITTHSPTVVAHAKPKELYLMERIEGRSNIKRAIDVEENLDTIIREDLIDLGEYWMSGGLGAVPESPDKGSGELFEVSK